ncbi:MAG TPA: hypothetical protein VFW45_15350 [Candidatus Polarisedimenticolia bacterium]|nr:hypothetical protein [Candidatus Polarisedimenticolia bacterium]
MAGGFLDARRSYLAAIISCLLIPVATIVGAAAAHLVDPEMANGTTNYTRNYLLLDWTQKGVLMGTAGLSLVLWIACCCFVLRARKRSLGWILLAAAGPFGLVVIASLKDRSPEPRDLYQRFLSNLAIGWRILFELAVFVLVWVLSYEAVVLERNILIQIESSTTGTPVATIIDRQNASSGMYAAGEGMEALFLVAMLYLLRPLLFNLAGGLFASRRPAAHPSDHRA